MEIQKNYIERASIAKVAQYREVFPVVGIVGPRQCGKSTLVKHLLGTDANTAYHDLENYEDRAKIAADQLGFFAAHKSETVVLDEIQRLPSVFETLRGIVDSDRRNGAFIVLGSASPELIKHTSESLAGRIGYIELTPFTTMELGAESLNRHWLRGGFPPSFLAGSDEQSILWRDEYLRTVAQRDIQQFRHVDSVRIVKLLQFIAHYHGQIENVANIAKDFSQSEPMIRSYIDTLEFMYLVRRLRPYHMNGKKRLVKKPKLYIRDSGLLHSIARIRTDGELAGHPLRGASFEGYVIENLASIFDDCEASFYRTSEGDEIDLLLTKGAATVAVEIKADAEPRLTKSGIVAVSEVRPVHTCIVAPSYREPFTTTQSYGPLTVGSLPQIIEVIKDVFKQRS